MRRRGIQKSALESLFMNFRNEAKASLHRAKQELSSGEDARLKYAALELRMAIECLIYEISKSYRDELSETDFNNKWQPKKLLELLIDIDPSVEKISEWAIGVQESKGYPSARMMPLGRDRRLSLKEIKGHYDQLGSYLHTPTIRQMEEGKAIDFKKICTRCKDLTEILDEVLSSSVHSTRMKSISKISCEKCNSTIIKNIPVTPLEMITKCRKCEACYLIKAESDGRVSWTPQVTDFQCGGRNCSAVAKLFDVEIKDGVYWDCKVCSGRNVICLGTVYQEPKNKN